MEDDGRAALERDVVSQWRESVQDGALEMQVRIVTVSGVNRP